MIVHTDLKLKNASESDALKYHCLHVVILFAR